MGGSNIHKYINLKGQLHNLTQLEIRNLLKNLCNKKKGGG